jgi:hypothetical protein
MGTRGESQSARPCAGHKHPILARLGSRDQHGRLAAVNCQYGPFRRCRPRLMSYTTRHTIRLMTTRATSDSSIGPVLVAMSGHRSDDPMRD